MDSSSGVFKSNQIVDYSIQVKEFPRVRLRYLYTRSDESRRGGVEGQDYLAWRYREDAFGFVVCDGVGGSFFGNIAARYLGERLIDDLLFDAGRELERARGESALAEVAAKHLTRWRDRGHNEVRSKELPDDLPSLQLEALRQLRDEPGSETIFACGRLGFEGQPAKLLLIWMGDTEVQLFDRQGKRVEIGGVWRNSDRWSTKRGIRGQVHAWIGDVEAHEIERIIAFSDGLSVIADRLYAIEDGELQTTVNEQLMSPSSDDISFIDIRLKPPDASGGLPAPQNPRYVSKNNKIEWSSVKGAESYEIEEAPHGLFYGGRSYTTQGVEWSLSDSDLPWEAVYRYYRVRAWAGKEPSQWSQVLPLPPAQLPAPGRVEIKDVPDDPATYTIAWEKVHGAQQYELTEHVEGHERGVYLGRETEYTITGRQPGTYLYQVRAWGAAGQGVPSERCEKKVAALPAVPEPDKTQGIPPTQPEVKILSRQDIRPTETKAHQKEDPSIPTISRSEQSKGLAQTQPEIKIRIREETPLSAAKARREKEPSIPTNSDAGRLRELAQTKPEIKIGTQQESPLSRAKALDAPKLREMQPVRVSQPYVIEWSKVMGADSYELEVAESEISFESGIYKPVYKGRDTSHRAGNDVPTTYHYRVRALAGVRHSDWSAPVAIKVEPLKPGAPRLHAIRNPSGGGTYDIEWTRVSGAEIHYVVEEAEKRRIGKWGDYKRIWSGRDQECSVQGREPGTYKYRVQACNRHGCGEYSDEVSVKVEKTRPAEPAQALQAPRLNPIDNPDGRDRYWVRWTHPARVTRGYVLYESQTSDFAQEEQVYQGLTKHKYITGKEPGTYYYRVFLCDSKDYYDPQKPSNMEQTTVILRPPLWNWPSRMCMGDGPLFRVKLHWQSVKWAKQYELRKFPEAPSSVLKRPFKIVELPKGNHYFRIRAISQGGIKSGWSSMLRVGVTVHRDHRGRERLKFECDIRKG